MATSDPNVANVSTAKPAVGGAIYIAPKGTAVPTSATASLNAAFEAMGYVSEDGVVNSNSPTSETIKAWGGDTVLVYKSEKPDTYQFTLLECLNTSVLKYVYGSSNVSGDLASGITIEANNSVDEEFAVVIDMILRGGVLRRIVIPDGSVSEVGEITYKDDEAIGYDTTLNCMPDSSGNTHYEYIQSATST